MRAKKASFCAEMGVESHAKLMISRQAVGLSVLLADADDFTHHMFGKQELWQHVLAAHTTSSLSLVHDVSHELSAQAMDGRPLPGELRAGIKKVRFAPDVVEPAGDSRVYRGGKNGANTMSKKKVGAVNQEHEECVDQTVSLNDEVLRASQVNSRCKAQTLVKPYLPANRMLLYKGKMLSRSMMALDCRV